MSIKASKIIGQTQRNWDETSPVTEEEIQYLVDVSSNAPTKNNLNLFKLFVSTNIEFNTAIQNWAYDTKENPNLNQKTKELNSQVAAPLLMMYLVIDRWPHDKEVSHPDCIFSAGVAAGATALASAELGYQTGFCSCMNLPGLVEYVSNKFNSDFFQEFWTDVEIHDVLCLGIGKKNPNARHRSQIFKDGKVKFSKRASNKKIKPSVLIYK